MTFWRTLKATYGGATAFLLACPLLALVPVVFEMIQHVVEVRIGMYDSIAAAKAVEHHPLRIGFGLLKITALTIPIYWVTRFLPARDARFAAIADPVAIRLFAGFLAFTVMLTAAQLALMTTGVPTVMIAVFVGGQAIGCLIAGWATAAPLGNAAIGPWRSVAIMAPQLPWTFGFSLATMLPLMVPHYMLGALALIGPRPLLWPVLALDSLLIGWLTAVMAASGYHVAVRAAKKAGVVLVPTQAVASDAGGGPVAA